MNELLEQLIVNLPYAGVVIILLASGFGLPIPEDVPLLVGGYCCGVGLANIWVMVPVALVSVLGGDCIVYGMGRRYGHHVQKLPLLRRMLTEQRLTRAELSFHAHGGKTLFLARFMPGLRAAVYFSAGTFKIPFWKMITFDGIAALLSVPLWVLAGWWFAEDIQRVWQWSAKLQAVLLGVVVVAAVGFMAWKVLRRPRVASAG